MALDTTTESIWKFRVNHVAPVIFAALFTATGCWHVSQASHYKSWKMTLLLPFGALIYVAGLVTREAASFFPGNDGLFVATRVLTLDATAAAAASNYFILGRTLYYIPWASPLDARRSTQIFIFLDWLIVIFVCVGLSHVYEDSLSDARLGSAFVKVASIMQIALYAFYLLILGIWDRRVLAANVERRLARRYLVALYACGVLILVRCFYRTIEYFQGAKGYLAVHEAYFYVFDGLAIFSMLVLLNVYHPGKFFPQDSSIYLATDGVSEVKGPGWSDKRRWYWAIVDPLGIGDWIKMEKNGTKFWESDGIQAEAHPIDSCRTSVA